MSLSDDVRITTDKAAWLSRRQVEDTVAPNRRARFAAAFIERWGCVAAIPDGEDSSGRQKLRMATPEELVGRAVTVAALLNEELISRGWLVDVPEHAPADNGDET